MVPTPLQHSYDFIVCGAGSSGSVVARRLADANASVLLVEAGSWDTDDVVSNPERWQANIGSERDWAFPTVAEASLKGRSQVYSSGKVLGGGSSINSCLWARGHASDWNHFAEVSGNSRWNNESVSEKFATIEDRGDRSSRFPSNGPKIALSRHLLQDDAGGRSVEAFLKSLSHLGFPTFATQNDELTRVSRGASVTEITVQDGKRQSVFDCYVRPALGKNNLTVLSDALVTRIVFLGRRAAGIQFLIAGELHTVSAAREIVLAAGAVQTPKLLMQSGIGPKRLLRGLGIEVFCDMPAIGQNLQNHVTAAVTWPASDGGLTQTTTISPAIVYSSSRGNETEPDVCAYLLNVPSPANTPGAPPTLLMAPMLVRPKSTGTVSLSGRDPSDPVQIVTNMLTSTVDLDALAYMLKFCRELGGADLMRNFIKGPSTPGADVHDLTPYLRQTSATAYHQCGTCRMGSDSDAVVDGHLLLRSFENLRIADASILPRITTGNTMAPCVIVGEVAAEEILAVHNH